MSGKTKGRIALSRGCLISSKLEAILNSKASAATTYSFRLQQREKENTFFDSCIKLFDIVRFFALVTTQMGSKFISSGRTR